MPAGFEWCSKQKGHRIRTIKPKGKGSRTYMHVCYLNGKSYPGEVKKRKMLSRGQMAKRMRRKK